VNWGSASEFFAMGGYGLYVWGAYGVTLALTRARHKQAMQSARFQRDEE
jgi:heme exporter protein D